MASIKLFKRLVRVVVSTIEIRDLDMVFRVQKSLKPEPNKAELAVFNLNPDHRAALSQLSSAPVLIEAGYVNGSSTLFLGDLRSISSRPEGPNWVTRLSSGDGEKAVKTARVKASFKRGTASPKEVLRALASALGVGEGNLQQELSALGLVNHFSEGVVLSGSAYREMNGICASLGLTWSIQNGNIQILRIGKALDGEAIKISESSGMIGAPSVDKDGVLKVTILLAPDIFPGRKLVIDSLDVKGQYRIESCEYAGDTSGLDWYCRIEAKRY